MFKQLRAALAALMLGLSMATVTAPAHAGLVLAESQPPGCELEADWDDWFDTDGLVLAE